MRIMPFCHGRAVVRPFDTCRDTKAGDAYRLCSRRAEPGTTVHLRKPVRMTTRKFAVIEQMAYAIPLPR